MAEHESQGSAVEEARLLRQTLQDQMAILRETREKMDAFNAKLRRIGEALADD